MTFGMTLAEHLTMAVSANMFYITIDYKNEPNVKVTASNANIKTHWSVLKTQTSHLTSLDEYRRM